MVVGSYYWMLFSDNLLAWENSRHLATPPLFSPRNGVWGTSAEIPDWWCATSKIWLPPPQTFSHRGERETRMTGVEERWTVEREKKNKRCEGLARFLLPTVLGTQILIEGKESAYEAEDMSSAASFLLLSLLRRHFAGKPVMASGNAAVSSG